MSALLLCVCSKFNIFRLNNIICFRLNCYRSICAVLFGDICVCVCVYWFDFSCVAKIPELSHNPFLAECYINSINEANTKEATTTTKLRQIAAYTDYYFDTKRKEKTFNKWFIIFHFPRTKYATFLFRKKAIACKQYTERHQNG